MMQPLPFYQLSNQVPREQFMKVNMYTEIILSDETGTKVVTVTWWRIWCDQFVMIWSRSFLFLSLVFFATPYWYHWYVSWIILIENSPAIHPAMIWTGRSWFIMLSRLISPYGMSTEGVVRTLTAAVMRPDGEEDNPNYGLFCRTFSRIPHTSTSRSQLV